MSMQTNSASPDTAEPTELLICAATWMELRAWWPRDQDLARLDEGQLAYSVGRAFFVTGVGIPASLARMLGVLKHVRPARILNIGIAGAYPDSGLNIGDIVIGTSEVYGDVGFELPSDAQADKFAVKGGGGAQNAVSNAAQSADALDPVQFARFQSVQTSPFAGALYAEPLPLITDAPALAGTAEYAVQTGRGCTVNMCAGTEQTGRMRRQMFDAHFESMEGAAVAQAGQLANVPVMEIRAISNIASTRDMRPDNIRLAIANLRDYLEQRVQHF